MRRSVLSILLCPCLRCPGPDAAPRGGRKAMARRAAFAQTL